MDAVTPPAAVPLAPLPQQPTGVPWPTLDWPTADPGGDVDVDELDRLVDECFDEAAEQRFGRTAALLVVRGGRIVVERHGDDKGPDDRLLSWSMAKSVTNALVGILVGEGRLDIDAPAAVPEWAGADDPRRVITVRDLLEMRPGLAFVEDYVDDTVSDCLEMLFGSGAADMGAFAAGKPLVAPPGTTLNYSSGTTNIVCRLVADIVGRGEAMATWMRSVLFEPLGMTSAEPTMDDSGVFVGSSYLRATPRDFARFGLLHLRDGWWEDAPILPPGWVDRARTPVARDADGRAYGSHWWVWDDPAGAFCAQGYETQRVLVVPDRDLVLVRLGRTPTELGPAVDERLRRIAVCFAPTVGT